MARKALLPFFCGLLKILTLLLPLLFLADQEAFGQLYRHDFNNQNRDNPPVISNRITASSWSSTGGSLYYRSVNTNPGIAILGPDHVYVLTLKMQERYQAEITSISLKKMSGDAATFQIKVNDENYGTSFGSSSSPETVTRTKTVSKLRNTITIKIAVNNGNDRNQQYTAIDDLVINGSVSTYDPAAEATPDANGVLYVNRNLNSPGSGGSWNSALSQLYYALEAAQNKPAVKEIWVAQGEYQPETQGGYFSMVNGVKIYGGFNGYEDSPLLRDVLNSRTVLKGRGNTVIYNNAVDNTARLEGFYISGGTGFLADGISAGGGMYNVNSSPVLANCIFTDNKTDPAQAQGIGGAIYNKNSNPAIIQSLFYLNEAKGSSEGAGGAIFNDNSSPVLTNCTLTENSVNGTSTDGNGGAISNTGNASPVIRNSIIWNNPDSSFPGGFSSISSLAPSDGAPSITYSLIQGGYAGGSNIIDADPQFENQSDHDYRQRNTSPAINAGDPATDLTLFPGDESAVGKDISTDDRQRNARIDVGVFEVVPLTKWRVSASNTSGNSDGLTWETAFPTLQEALQQASQDDEIWVAKGEYQPAEGESFSLIHGVKFYGGFNGDESSPDDRPKPLPRGNVPGATILKGNGGSVIFNFYNNLDQNDVFDGFTVKGGTAESGAGMYLLGVSLTITNCAFIDNQAENDGGAIYLSGGALSAYNTVFFNNKALNGSGGALYFTDSYSSVALYNCLFTGNTASQAGGAVMNTSTSLTVFNCTWSRNTASAGGALGVTSPGSAYIYNSIISGNSSGIFKLNADLMLSTSLIQGVSASSETGNLEGSWDPQFTNPDAGDFTLKSCSPTINRGLVNFELPTQDDLNGNVRISNVTIDMGAYEFQGIPQPTGLPSDAAAVTMYLFGGVTSFTQDCETLAFVEPTGDDPLFANMSVKSNVAPGQTLVAGQKVFVKRYVDITPEQVLQGNTTANVTLFFTKQEFDDYNTAYGNAHNASLPAHLKVVAYHGTSPTGLPETYSGAMEIIKNVEVTTSADGNIYMVKFAVTEFSGFFVSGQSEAALPVTLASFNVVKKESAAYLTWQTSSEMNSEAFEIQHSINGKTWTNIGEVRAAENAAILTDYSFTHPNPQNGANLYRLKMLDQDGTFAFSTIRSLDFDHLSEIALFPNPAVRVRTVSLKGIFADQVEWIKIYSSDGRLMQVVNQPKGNSVDISNLPDGTYQVGISQKNGAVKVSKMIVIH
jgi:predicted outer membrane repeat protein